MSASEKLSSSASRVDCDDNEYDSGSMANGHQAETTADEYVGLH